MIVIGSAFICIPLGLIIVIYLSQYATKKARSTIKPILEILAEFQLLFMVILL